MSLFKELEAFYKERYKGWGGASQFEGTAERLERLVDEMCWVPSRIEEEVSNCFKAAFPDPFNEMLVSGPTSVWTLCPHHLVPCNFLVHIGYVPNGQVLGLSKFSRLALILGKRPVMQEQYNREVADILMEKLKPQGCGVYVVGSHGCISGRGVGQPGIRVSTSVVRGCFYEDPSVKAEFFSICGHRYDRA